MKKDFYLVEKNDNLLFIICDSDCFYYLVGLQSAYVKNIRLLILWMVTMKTLNFIYLGAISYFFTLSYLSKRGYISPISFERRF